VGARPGRRSTVETVLAGLLLAVALPAVAGGIGLLTGVIEPPAEDLADTPFDSYVIPGVLLAVVVGGSSAIAAAAVWRRHRLGPAVALVAGLGLMIWIVSSDHDQFSPLQPAYLVAGSDRSTRDHYDAPGAAGAVTGPRFRRCVQKGLEGSEIGVPAASSDPTVAIVAFQRHQQADVDSGFPGSRRGADARALRDTDDLSSVVARRAGSSTAAWPPPSGRRTRHRTLTAYTDVGRVLALDLTGTARVVVLVLDPDGTNGAPSAGRPRPRIASRP
jgi:hypothetical protein